MPNIYGIDISKHNGTVDWKKVKAAGKDFAFIRLGWAGYDGRIVANGGLDPLFESNIKAACAAGLDVGVYIYSYCKTPEAAAVAAREALELINPYQLAYPIAFDIEDPMHYTMGKATNTAIVKEFLSIIEEAKYYGLLYTYKNFADTYLDMSQLSQFDVWIAQYAAKCTYGGKYGIWQYAGDVKGFVGSCPGVTGACDLNIAYKDYAKIIRDAGLNGFAAAPPPQEIAPPPGDTVPAAEFDALSRLYDTLLDDHQHLQADYDELAKLHDAKVDELDQIKQGLAALAQKWIA